MIFDKNEESVPKFGNLDASGVSDNDGVKAKAVSKSVNMEFTVTIVKLLSAIACMFAGVFLIYKGVQPDAKYSIEIGSVKLKDTPIGLVLVLVAGYLLKITKLDVKL